jgi:hypothetical protein
MIAHILHDCGLYLGPKEKWDTVAFSNPDGFWEHVDFLSINDEILAKFDGGWDFPPHLPKNWHHSEKLQDLRDRAEKLIASFSDKEFWGWKDPRNSLTLPFWKDLIPDLKVIHCVRSPVEVSKSLKNRGSNSGKFSFSLWDHYTNSLMMNAKDSSYLVTNYHNYFLSPFDEISRLLEFIGLDFPDSELENLAAQIIKPSLFKQTSTLEELLDMPRNTKDLYIQVLKDSNEYLDRILEKLDESQTTVRITAIYTFELEHQLRNALNQISEQQKQIAEQQKQIAQLQKQIAQLQQERNVLLTQIDFKEQQNQNLAMRSKELTEIHSSRAWKFIQNIRKIRSWFIPGGKKASLSE